MGLLYKNERSNYLEKYERNQTTANFLPHNHSSCVLGQVETIPVSYTDNRMLGGRGFWHCNASRDNKWAAGDTFAGSVWIINTETGERHHLVTDCKMRPDHAQPFFSPDGRRLCFQSGHFTDGKRLTLMMIDLDKLEHIK